MRGALEQSKTDRSHWSNRWSRHEINALRRAYFSRLSRADSCVNRFGVHIDRVIEQVVDARRRRSAMARRPEMLHLDDAALAAACVDLDGAAWAYLIDLHEPGLVAAAELHVDSRCSLVTVRRLLSTMRKEARLRRYAADMPLQSWLIEQLMADLAVREPRLSGELFGVDPRTRLAMKLLCESRGSIRRAASSVDQGADRTGS